MGCQSGVTRGNGGGSHNGKTYIRGLVSKRKSSYLFSISMLMSFWSILRKPVFRQVSLSSWSTRSRNILNSLTISWIQMNLSSTGYLPHLHHPGWVIIVSSASEYMVSPSVSHPFEKRAKHLKLSTGFCGS